MFQGRGACMVARYHVVAELVKNFVIVNSVLDDAHFWPRPRLPYWRVPPLGRTRRGLRGCQSQDNHLILGNLQ
jgi:hypothetical protein